MHGGALFGWAWLRGNGRDSLQLVARGAVRFRPPSFPVLCIVIGCGIVPCFLRRQHRVGVCAFYSGDRLGQVEQFVPRWCAVLHALLGILGYDVHVEADTFTLASSSIVRVDPCWCARLGSSTCVGWMVLVLALCGRLRVLHRQQVDRAALTVTTPGYYGLIVVVRLRWAAATLAESVVRRALDYAMRVRRTLQPVALRPRVQLGSVLFGALVSGSSVSRCLFAALEFVVDRRRLPLQRLFAGLAGLLDFWVVAR